MGLFFRQPTPTKAPESQTHLSKAELLQRKKQQHRKRRLYLQGIGVFVVCVLCVGFFWIPYFQVNTISVTGLETLDSDTVTRSVQTTLSSRKLLVLPGQNIFLINKKQLSNNLRTTFSRIDTVKIKKHFTSLDVQIVERKPTTLWCSGEDKDAPCYFVHQDGVVFDEAGKFSNPLYFVFYTPLATPEHPVGSYVLPPEEFTRIRQITDALQSYGVSVYGYSAQDMHEEKFFVSPIYFGQESAYVKTRMDQTADTIASNLVTALKSDALLREKNNQFSNTNYIDLRFDGKVFYKLTTSTQ